MNRAHAVVLTVLLLLSACTMRSAIDALTSAEDRAFAQAFVDGVRRGDNATLEPMFDPKAWQQSTGRLAQAQRLFPPSLGETELVSFQVSSQIADGARSASKSYVLVTHDGSHWTTTRIHAQASGDVPQRVVSWQVDGSRDMPGDYRAFQTMNAMAKGAWIGAVIVLILLVGGIVWLVRRGRRRRNPSTEGSGHGPA